MAYDTWRRREPCSIEPVCNEIRTTNNLGLFIFRPCRHFTFLCLINNGRRWKNWDVSVKSSLLLDYRTHSLCCCKVCPKCIFQLLYCSNLLSEILWTKLNVSLKVEAIAVPQAIITSRTCPRFFWKIHGKYSQVCIKPRAWPAQFF